MRKIYITLLLLFITVNIFATKSYAQGVTSLNEAISPSLNTITLDKGSFVRDYVTFYNNTLFPMAIKVYAENFGTVGLNGNTSFFIDKSTLSASSWFSFKKLDYAISPKSNIKIPIYIKVPLDARSGGHYVSVFFQSLSIEQSNSNVGIVPRLGSLFFITIGGNINYNSRINSVSIKTNIPHFSNVYFPLFNISNINIKTIVQNLGNTYINEHGYLNVQNMLRDNSKSFNLPAHLILQNEKRALDKNISYSFNMGSYRISSTMIYGYNQKSKNITVIYIIPMSIIIVLLIFLIGLCILIIAKNKHLISVRLVLERIDYEIKKYKKTTN